MEASVHVDSFLGAGHYMTTDETLSADGVINAFTRTRSVTWFGGFTGGVQVLMVDDNGVVIGTTSQRRYGVDGTKIGRSDRTEQWNETIDPSIFNRTVKLAVIHAWTPKVSIAQIIAVAIDAGRTIWELLEELNKKGGCQGGVSY
ncbi:hypothetical protein [Bacillus nitratireducens]|uniref:hypothetical protein n=1 Tax=Bacillus nitratireducens TaxID=2026193 RepID=UPI001BA88446|nr:hypothetical protein [Bacillus nitratireducens]QUG87083.1 hypothetical protein GSN03_27210 [Bacillus nitratireducens]